jgi:hypothetical protein
MGVIESASRWDIGAIVARESAETLIGRATGARVAAARRLLRPAAHLVASRFVEYDRALGDQGPVRGAEWIVERATGGIVVGGMEHVPPSGATLVVANHPGLADAVALLAAMRRDDAWIVTADYPFLRALCSAKQRFLFVEDRGTALRVIARRLRAKEAVLLFPAGGLEPDPARSPAAARASLGSWSRSLDLIARLAPDTRVVRAGVSGVVSQTAFEHPLARRRSPLKEQQRFASLLQLAFGVYRHESIAVRFGTALPTSTGHLSSAVLASMTDLIQLTITRA